MHELVTRRSVLAGLLGLGANLALPAALQAQDCPVTYGFGSTGKLNGEPQIFGVIPEGVTEIEITGFKTEAPTGALIFIYDTEFRGDFLNLSDKELLWTGEPFRFKVPSGMLTVYGETVDQTSYGTYSLWLTYRVGV